MAGLWISDGRLGESSSIRNTMISPPPPPLVLAQERPTGDKEERGKQKAWEDRCGTVQGVQGAPIQLLAR